MRVIKTNIKTLSKWYLMACNTIGVQINRVVMVILITIVVLLVSCKSKSETGNVTTKKSEIRPNIILMMADDQGWGDTGYNGHPYLRTPNLDAMADNGAVFNRFYAASSVCSPTRGSVMTGRHPLRYGICKANCGHLKKEEYTIGELAKAEGYATGHFGKWHLGTLTKDTLDANRGGRKAHDAHYAPPWEHGFDVSFVTESKVPTWNPMITPSIASGDVKKTLVRGESFGTSYWSGPNKIVNENLEGDDSRIIMDRVIPFIENAVETNKPFLSIVWFHSPHLPVVAGDNYRKPYDELSLDQQHYYGVISAMDEQVGRLRAKLKELSISENTVLFYTSDNGPEGKLVEGRTQGLTKGLRGRKRSLYEGGIRVPGIMEWHGKIEPGIKVEIPCFTSDYFPTIENLLGSSLVDDNRPFDGVDLIPIVKKDVKERLKPLAFEFQGQSALIDNNFKIYRKNKDEIFELYNIGNDPAEKHNLANNKPEKLENMKAAWRRWKTSVMNSSIGQDY
ncbi:sulfatase family protein [Zobellia galactanivorans]|uniref:Sulfatase, family S1-23 n=1 Tax=Zobellia galactanivorans (strain DSM 12802 / CCUG 47099 / CIP 106680 / NCIMB 13871 / Dsij) TaxID=63186 RepID=G0LA52_ZOBGA|nr:sulfatase-like hydrolase/transferase [Zobellia galactanivorans]CAZ95056.1 Sulfatase, family S1-23 [Zobellia galactanivorans]